MSFNDIPEFRKALERLTIEYPKLIPAGARSLLWVIVGWPNGCFIGQEALANQAGLAISTKDTYLRKLTKLGFIDREQSHGRKGLQQNYRVNVRNMSNYNCLSPVVGISNPVLPTKSESLPITDAPIASNLLYAYKEDKDNKDDRERFNEVILKGVPSELRSTVNAGRNIEELLNEAESLELSRNAIRDYLNVTNWQNVNSAGGIVITRLGELITERKKQLALAEQVAESNRLWALEQAESERLKVSPDGVDKYVSEALEAMRLNKP